MLYLLLFENPVIIDVLPLTKSAMNIKLEPLGNAYSYSYCLQNIHIIYYNFTKVNSYFKTFSFPTSHHFEQKW